MFKFILQLAEDYNFTEGDDIINTTDPGYDASLEDFDLSDGVENLTLGEREIYEKLLETTSSDETDSSGMLKIRKNAPKADASEEFTLDLSKLPVKKGNGGNYAMQSFYVGSKYIYITQHIYNETKKTNTLYIFRGVYKNGKATMSKTDYMEIKAGGHGQTLEVYEYNGSTYLLIDVNANKEADGWGKEIARIKYNGNAHTNGSAGACTITSFDRIRYLSYAYHTTTSTNTVHRCDAALSTDKKYILIWTRSEKVDGVYNTVLTVHSFDAINKALDNARKSKISYINMKNNTAIKKLAGFMMKSSDSSIKYINSKSRGVELSNKGSNGLHSIYWCLGDEKLSGAANTLGIKRYNSDGDFKTDRRIDHEDIADGAAMEMEGLSIPQSGDKIRFGLVPISGAKDKQYICTIKKSELVSD